MINAIMHTETYITRRNAAFPGIDASARPLPGGTGNSRGIDAGAGGDSLS